MFLPFPNITLRASLAAGVGFFLAVILGPWVIAWLQTRFREPLKSDSARLNELHRAKAATPTMGGLFVVAGLVAGVLALGDWGNAYLHAALVVAVGLAALGAVDDLVKLRTRANGLRPRTKFAGQLVVCTIAATIVYARHATLADGLVFHLPLAGWSCSLGPGFVPLAVLVMVATSNAVNLTDGLDGLAGGCLVFALAAMTLVAYAAGHAEWAAYLGVPHIRGAGEMAVLGGALLGAVLGFLWFNCHPAQVFLGDTGSLPLGGLLGLMAVVSRQELLLAAVGGVFVAEAGSVILQVGWYKWTRRRIFRCAPLHHHFQFQGWPETRIVVRFWIASALCALVGLATLKLKAHESAAGPMAADRAASVAASGESHTRHRVR